MIDTNIIVIIRPVAFLDVTFACGYFVTPCSVEAGDSDSTSQFKIGLASKRDFLAMPEIQAYSLSVLWIARIGAGLWKFEIYVYKFRVISWWFRFHFFLFWTFCFFSRTRLFLEPAYTNITFSVLDNRVYWNILKCSSSTLRHFQLLSYQRRYYSTHLKLVSQIFPLPEHTGSLWLHSPSRQVSCRSLSS